MLSYFLNIFTVFPTHVGMILLLNIYFWTNLSIPHACGDDPAPDCHHDVLILYSPHMWG